MLTNDSGSETAPLTCLNKSLGNQATQHAFESSLDKLPLHSFQVIAHSPLIAVVATRIGRSRFS